MRILSLDYECNIRDATVPLKGGTARFARDFSQAVVESGHTWLGVLQRKDLSESPWKCIEESPGKEFYAIASRDMRINEVAALNSLAEIEEKYRSELDALRSVIQHLHPDVVFLNGFSQYSWLLYKAAKAEGIPVAMQHAGLWVRDLAASASSLPPGYIQLGMEMEREATEGVTINIFLNEYSKKVLIRDLSLQYVPGIHIVPLPHAGWDFSGTYTPGDGKERKIGIVARWDRIKNHQAVLAFSDEVHRRKLPWKIVSVTSIPESSINAELKQLYKSSIEVIPVMERDHLRTFYESIDALILPSHFDVSPTVVMESIAVGKPTLISPDVGWVSEYEACGMEDWIIDFSDSSAVVARFEELFARSTWPEVQLFASYVAQHHDPNVVYGRYLSLFEQMIAS